METSGLLPTPTVRGNYNRKGMSKKSGNGLATALTLSLEDSLVSHSAEQENEKEQTTTAISGQKCIESFKSFDRATSWQKTFADCLVSKGDWYSRQCVLTWKLSATKSNRLLFQLAPSALPTEGIESGLLRTPNTNQRGTRSAEGLTKGHQLELQDQIRMLPTPQVFDATATMLIGKEYNGKTAHAEKLGQAINRRGGMNGLRLQPDFAGWMMGYPLGYLDLEAGEMPRSKRMGMR
jgi:hypothetical protein